MNLTSKLILHLDDDRSPPLVPAVQSDTARSVEVALYAGGQPWDIPADASASIRYRRADGSGGKYDTLPDGSKAWSTDGNTVTIALDAAVLGVPGTATMQIALHSGEEVLSTFSFQIQVQADPSVGTSAPAVPPQSGSAAVDLQPLTFTGAVDATYDGKSPVTVNIPVGGDNAPDIDLSDYYTKSETDTAIADAIADIEFPEGGGGTDGGTWQLMQTINIAEDISSITSGLPSGYDEVFIKFSVRVTDTNNTDVLGTGVNVTIWINSQALYADIPLFEQSGNTCRLLLTKRGNEINSSWVRYYPTLHNKAFVQYLGCMPYQSSFKTIELAIKTSGLSIKAGGAVEVWAR